MNQQPNEKKIERILMIVFVVLFVLAVFSTCSKTEEYRSQPGLAELRDITHEGHEGFVDEEVYGEW